MCSFCPYSSHSCFLSASKFHLFCYDFLCLVLYPLLLLTYPIFFLSSPHVSYPVFSILLSNPALTCLIIPYPLYSPFSCPPPHNTHSQTHSNNHILSRPTVMCDPGANAGAHVTAQGLRPLPARLPQNYTLPEVAKDGGAPR